MGCAFLFERRIQLPCFLSSPPCHPCGALWWWGREQSSLVKCAASGDPESLVLLLAKLPPEAVNEQGEHRDPWGTSGHSESGANHALPCPSRRRTRGARLGPARAICVPHPCSALTCLAAHRLHADEEGRTALHWAVDRGHVNSTRVLLQKGAAVDVQVLSVIPGTTSTSREIPLTLCP